MKRRIQSRYLYEGPDLGPVYLLPEQCALVRLQVLRVVGCAQGIDYVRLMGHTGVSLPSGETGLDINRLLSLSNGTNLATAIPVFFRIYDSFGLAKWNARNRRVPICHGSSPGTRTLDRATQRWPVDCAGFHQDMNLTRDVGPHID
jgi:hypothetical protein